MPTLEKRLELTNWLFFACLAIAALVFMSWDFTLGLLLGGAISSLNFHLLKRDLKIFCLPGGHKRKNRSILHFYLRFALTAAALYYIISRELADIFGLLIGLSLVVLGLLLGILREYRLLSSSLHNRPSPRDTIDKGNNLK